MTSPPPPRKFPPPCWSDEEAQALISVFKQKWSSLNRANLKSHDWDDVAASLAALFPHISPSKTAVQCHNKVEKLRKRFRSEKLRASTRPGRSSPWALYPFLQDLDTSAGPTVPEINNNSPAAHFPVKSLGHRHVAAAHAPWLEEASYSKRRRSAVKEDDDDVEEEDEVVAAIRRLGEKYMEVEKRKMETAREIVMMQMDMEMKQTKAVMESQQQMLAALLSDSSGENKKKKKRKSNAAAAEGDESS